MQNNYLEYLILTCKKFARTNKVFDIILYGSYVKGKLIPNDIDLLLIFKEMKLTERTEIAQKLKDILNKKIKKLDIKTINIYEIFEKDFLARQSILVEGRSLIHNEPFSKRMGFEGYCLFSYNLKNLNHNEKTKFTYSLIGRKNEGIIKKLEIEHLGKGVLIVPVKNSSFLEEFFEKWKINYKKRNILISLV